MTKSRWVIKIGSNVLYSGGLNLIKNLAKQVHILRRIFNIDVIWITSGAVAMGREYLTKKNVGCDGLSKRALSTIGQLMVMNLYKTAFEIEGLDCAQRSLGSLDSHRS